MLIQSNKIAEWGDPLTPPESETECTSYASGDWPWPAHGQWKTCNGWTTKWRHMEVEAFLDFNGPDNVTEDAKNAVGNCALVAAAAAGVVSIVTDGAGAAAAAQTAFITCLKAKAIQEADKYSVSFRTATHWTDWA
jgi:hypothetical protein